MYKGLGRKKIVVLWIAFVFILGAFIPSIDSQNVKIMSNPFSNKFEKINDGVGESVDSTDAIDSDTMQQEKQLSKPGPLPLGADAPWWNTNWQYRQEITINHSKVEASLTNFPVLINFNSDTDLANNTQDDGDDIVFTNDNGNQLHHEIEYFDSSTGELVCWVNVTSVSSAEDTAIYIYYGNPDCGSQQNFTNVWNSGFVMVQHLNETSGTHYDSTSYGNDGSPQGTLNQNAAGKFDGADEFDGIDDYVNCGNDSSLSISDMLSVEAWVNYTEIGSGTWRGVVTKNDYLDWAFAVGGTQAPGKAVIYISGADGNSSGDVISTSTINDSKWHHIVATYDGSTTRLYVDGMEEANSTTLTGDIHASTKNMLIGHYENLPRIFDGGIDEVRVSNAARNADWIMTEFNNQNASSTFYSVSSEEILNMEPTANFTYIPENPSTLDTIQFTDISTDSDGTIVSWLWDFDDGNTSTQQNPSHQYADEGTYNVNLTVTDDDDAVDTISKAIEIVDDTISPIVNIIKPQKALYILNFKIRSFLIRKPFIIGKINITVNATDDESGIERVEIFIDGELKANVTTQPYYYMWKREGRMSIFGHKHTIKVVAYDNAGNNASKEIKVWKFL